MSDIVLSIALIGVLGIGAQWIAWRTQTPAIVILLAAGFLAGPVLGWLHPVETFGDVLSPVVSIAVAIILFEGGLSLDFKEIRETAPTVRRFIFLGAPATWGLAFLAAHYLAGLSTPTAAVISGILVVTGPTVIMPLLRQTRLPRGAASLLRWEAIVADPIGALFAVVAYEGAVALSEGRELTETALRLGGAVFFGAIIAFAIARGLVLAFVRGQVPEFLKGPILLVVVITVFEATNLILEEAGLLTVTLLGVALANTRLASLEELRRLKEMITILLVSGLFIVLTASTSMADVMRLGPSDFLFVAVLLFVIRPVVVLLTTLGGKVSWRERILCAWIAPRGVVAVAVSGLFATSLAAHGFSDADRMAPLAFLVVVVTVVLHGFSIRPVARALGLTASEPPGLLLVGASAWTTQLSIKMKEAGLPVLLADTNWNRLVGARQAGVPVYYGEILSEAAEHKLEMSRYGALIAASDNDAYNALVCTDLGPEMGRSNVFQLGRAREKNGTERAERHQLHFTVGGRTLFRDGIDYYQLQGKLVQGWEFSRTKLTDTFDLDAFIASRPDETRILFAVKANGRLSFSTTAERVNAVAGDTVVSFGPPAKNRTAEKVDEKAEKAVKQAAKEKE